jgi:hypothetical protein
MSTRLDLVNGVINRLSLIREEYVNTRDDIDWEFEGLLIGWSIALNTLQQNGNVAKCLDVLHEYREHQLEWILEECGTDSESIEIFSNAIAEVIGDLEDFGEFD